MDLLFPGANEKSKGLSSDVSIDKEEVVLGHTKRLRQILTNLIGNAIKFTDPGNVSLSAQPVDQLSDKRRVLFIVKNTGIGITVDQQSQIFDAFFQVASSAARRFDGTGLGLSVTRQVVELMGVTWDSKAPTAKDRYSGSSWNLAAQSISLLPQSIGGLSKKQRRYRLWR